jgi:hypothetical protein
MLIALPHIVKVRGLPAIWSRDGHVLLLDEPLLLWIASTSVPRSRDKLVVELRFDLLPEVSTILVHLLIRVK